MTIKVILFKDNTVFSKVIKLVTRSPYSHCAVAIDSTLYEASPDAGVRFVENWERQYADRTYDVYTIDMDAAQVQAMRMFIVSQLGKPYDWLGVVSFITCQTRESRKSKGKWFCPELVLCAFEKAGKPLLRMDPWKASPDDVSKSELLTGPV